MSWRKEYKSVQEKKQDQHIGFFACLIVNLILFIGSIIADDLASYDPTVQDLRLLLPWIVNISIIVLALIFRPELTTGYLTFFGVSLIGSTLFGVIVVAACFAAMVITVPIGLVSGGVLAPVALIISLIGSFSYLASKIGGPAWSRFADWWRVE
jgi:hypothetical protein